MVHADQRCCLRQPIPLDYGITDSSPELLGLPVERRASRDKCPELPAKLSMYFSKRPPASQELLPLRGPEPPAELLLFPAIFFPAIFFAAIFQIALNLLFQ